MTEVAPPPCPKDLSPGHDTRLTGEEPVAVAEDEAAVWEGVDEAALMKEFELTDETGEAVGPAKKGKKERKAKKKKEKKKEGEGEAPLASDERLLDLARHATLTANPITLCDVFSSDPTASFVDPMDTSLDALSQGSPLLATSTSFSFSQSGFPHGSSTSSPQPVSAPVSSQGPFRRSATLYGSPLAAAKEIAAEPKDEEDDSLELEVVGDEGEEEQEEQEEGGEDKSAGEEEGRNLGEDERRRMLRRHELMKFRQSGAVAKFELEVSEDSQGVLEAIERSLSSSGPPLTRTLSRRQSLRNASLPSGPADLTALRSQAAFNDSSKVMFVEDPSNSVAAFPVQHNATSAPRRTASKQLRTLLATSPSKKRRA